MGFESKLGFISDKYVRMANGKVNWNKTLPRYDNESDKEYQNRKHKTRSRYSHELAMANPSEKEKRYNRAREWKSINKTDIRKTANKWYDGNRFQVLWQAARQRSIKSGMEFSLSVDKVKEAIDLGVCEVTGLKFAISNHRRNAFSPSIDRIDNSKGYTDDNCKIVCWCFNTGKNHFDVESYIELCEAVIKNKQSINETYRSNGY